MHAARLDLAAWLIEKAARTNIAESGRQSHWSILSTPRHTHRHCRRVFVICEAGDNDLGQTASQVT